MERLGRRDPSLGQSTAIVRRNRIVDNFIGSGGGGIELNGASSVLIESNVIAGNTAQRGGGIEMMNGLSVMIAGNLIVRNRASEKGGGILWMVPAGDTRLVNNTIAENDCPFASGLFADGYDVGAVLVNNTIIRPRGGQRYSAGISTTSTFRRSGRTTSSARRA